MQDPEGRIWLSLKRLCEAIGIDYKTQYRKLKSVDADWAFVVIMTMNGSDGRSCQMVMIDLDTMLTWLGGISPNKVQFEVRVRACEENRGGMVWMTIQDKRGRPQRLTMNERSLPFHCDNLEVIRWAGKCAVHIKPICNGLGISDEPQWRKLRDAAWSGATIMVAPDERGRPQRLRMIPIGTERAKLTPWRVI